MAYVKPVSEGDARGARCSFGGSEHTAPASGKSVVWEAQDHQGVQRLRGLLSSEDLEVTGGGFQFIFCACSAENHQAALARLRDLPGQNRMFVGKTKLHQAVVGPVTTTKSEKLPKHPEVTPTDLANHKRVTGDLMI